MKDKLKKYNAKRNFNRTKEPKGKVINNSKRLRFVVQHHIARKDHYDFRLEFDGVLKSWAVPKGPSYDPKDKRLAIMVEDHPLSYRNFEGTIPKGEYGGGVVMIWDEGYWEPLGVYNEKSFKFILKGKRLNGKWTLINFKDNNWLLIKEKDEFVQNCFDIEKYKVSIRSGKTMKEIENDGTFNNINITNPNKIIFDEPRITKLDIVEYYKKVSERMMPFLENRIISVIRAPEGIKKEKFFKKHLDNHNAGIGRINIKNEKNKKEDYYYIKDAFGIITEVQMNSYEFHIWGSKVEELNNPDYMVFDLDPDENVSLKTLREGVKDLKSILDELSLKSFLKTSGGKGYHVVVPINLNVNWNDFRKIAKNIASLMEIKWPNKYVTNMRIKDRKNKIFIDWVRNTKSSTSVAPYSIRLREGAPVSFPIRWDELDKIKPNEINIKKALKKILEEDPWKDFFE